MNREKKFQLGYQGSNDIKLFGSLFTIRPNKVARLTAADISTQV